MCNVAIKLSPIHLSKTNTRNQHAPLEVSRQFSLEQLTLAISALPSGKALRFDIISELLNYAGLKVKEWLVEAINALIAHY